MNSTTHDVPFHARHDDELLTLDDVAEILRTPVNTVRWWRQEGTGPEFFKIGRRLYTTVGEKGWILGDPRAAQGPAAAMAKGIANFQRTMAAAGMSLEQNMHMEMKGEGPMAGIMGRMFKIDQGHVVTKIETGDIDAALFDVPAGYKVKQN